jgi:hypothetical protein
MSLGMMRRKREFLQIKMNPPVFGARFLTTPKKLLECFVYVEKMRTREAPNIFGVLFQIARRGVGGP